MDQPNLVTGDHFAWFIQAIVNYTIGFKAMMVKCLTVDDARNLILLDCQNFYVNWL